MLLPDDLVLPSGVLERMAAVRRARRQRPLRVRRAARRDLRLRRVRGLRHRRRGRQAGPRHGREAEPDQAPSTFAAAGRYLLDLAIFDALDRITPGPGGELQLTDAVPLLIWEGHPVHVVVHRGGRHDLGNPGSYVRAFVDFALKTPSTGRPAGLARRAAGSLVPCGPSTSSCNGSWTWRSARRRYGWRSPRPTACAAPRRSSPRGRSRFRPGGDRRLRRPQRRRLRRGRASPVDLPVVGEIPAGSRHPLRLQPGQAVRVAAGAPLPTLADAVVPVG